MAFFLNIFSGISFFLTEKSFKRTSFGDWLQCLLRSGFFYLIFASFILPIKAKSPELCVVGPLQTTYVNAYEETSSACTSCFFPPSASPSAFDASLSEVHVLEATPSEGTLVEVSLNTSAVVAKGKSRALVLASSADSTTFIISVDQPQMLLKSTFQFVLTGNVEVLIQSPLMDFTIVRKTLWSSQDIVAIAKKHFGFVSSSIQAKNIDRISLNLNLSYDDKSNSCNNGLSFPSSLASCSKTRRQELSGCFHEDMIGVQQRDIHIIDVDGSYNSNDSILLLITGIASPDASDNLHDKGTSSLMGSSIASLTVSPTDSGVSKIGVLRRNLTIILKSGRPTTWTLKISNIQGIISLYVGEGDQVENTSSPGQNLSVSVKSIDLPTTFDGLILRVLTTIGPPLLYTKAKTPNLFKMIVPSTLELSNSLLKQQTNILKSLDWEKAYSLVKESVSVFCLDDGAYISLPLEVSKKVGGIEMAFTDHSCPATYNTTHLTLSSKFVDCGFTKQQVDETTELYTNFVHIDMGSEYRRHPLTSDDEDDYEGSAFGQEDSFQRGKIPVEIVQCKRTISSPFYEELNGGNLGAEYRLQMFHDSNLLKPLKKHDFPLDVPHKVSVHAKLSFWQDNYHMTSRSGIRLLIEECLLSRSPSTLTNPVTLIRKSCAVQPYVSMENIENDIAIHFQISNEYPGKEKIFLHCQVGVCSDGVLPRPSIKKCVDPSIYCGKETLLTIFTNQAMGSILKTVIAGPFIKESSTLDDETNTPYGKSSEKTEIVVMEGLSTEVVVGIAIAAFVIGLCLMATLWVIYLKTDPHHQMRPKTSVPRNCGYDLSGHSGSSTPSSQAPMTA